MEIIFVLSYIKSSFICCRHRILCSGFSQIVSSIGKSGSGLTKRNGVGLSFHAGYHSRLIRCLIQ